jgi:hypothetical protein
MAGLDLERPCRVLFVGNSYTYCNDLPGVLAKLAAAGDPPFAVQTDASTQGGWSLQQHWAGGEALEKIRQGCWDFVALQDKSTGPIDWPGPASMKAHARKFDAEIRKAGAQTAFYMTWARRHKPAMIETLAEHYDAIGDELDAFIAPVGRAWQRAFAARPELVLHVEDQSHPNELGTYLAACVFCATLFGHDPRGLPDGGLSSVTADDAAFPAGGRTPPWERSSKCISGHASSSCWP